MGRKRDDVLWAHVERTNDGIRQCIHCRAEFRGNPSATRLRNHLLGVPGGGISRCTQVPDHVKNALAAASTSSKRPRIEPPSSINNNDFDNQGQGDNGQQMHEELQCIQDCLEGSFTSAQNRWNGTSELCDMMAKIYPDRIGSGSSIDDVNNLASTSAPQQNNKFQNRMQADQEVVQGTEQGRFADGIVLMDANQSKGKELITVPLDGQTTAERNLEEIWRCLINEDTLSIGVYGMGGVGKTTIITNINNQLLKDSSFDKVYWVTVSQQSSIFKLQSDISKEVELDLSMEMDEKKRAAELFHKLEKCKKFILILDDMWEIFPVEKVGIPLRINGGKLLLTTRSWNVCQGMECEQIVKVEPLSKEESWNLFKKKMGPNRVLAPDIEGIAKCVAKECAGLPLAIVTVARSMRGEEDISDWRNALNELKYPRNGLNHYVETEVFKPLKFSYDRLNDERLQQCLLYCSLFPEDHEIKRNDLIGYWIGEGLIDELESRLAAFDRGNAMINRLINACLLESADVHSVKMHDVIRDMALIVARRDPMFMVKAGVHLRDFPAGREWLVNLDRVSLMNNFSLKGCYHDLSPNCPRLKTLFLQGNIHLRKLPNCFFVNMQSLNVLDLSDTDIDQLPDSLSNMGELRVLRLRSCRSLKWIPSLAELENLQELDLCSSKVEELPNGIERLVNLRVLDLSRTLIQGLIPSEVLQKLSHLQTLQLWKCDVEVLPEALVSLGELEILVLSFSEIHSFNSYVKTEDWQRLSQYSIGTGFSSDSHQILFDIRQFTSTMEYGRAVIQDQKDHFFLPNDVMDLHISGCSNGTSLVGDHGVDANNLPMFTVCGGIFDNLKVLNIQGCDQLKHMVSSSLAQQLFQNLTWLEVRDCENLVELIAAEGESFNQSSSSSSRHNDIVLPKLKNMNLVGLPKLKSIYRGTMVCHSLRRIEVSECPMYKKLRLSMEQDEQNTSLLPRPRLEKIKGEREWWELVEWDHPDAKIINLNGIPSFVHMIPVIQ